MVVRLLIILIVNCSMLMVMITLKKVFSVTSILSLKSSKKDLELLLRKDSNIRFPPTLTMKSINIENILILFPQLIIQKSLVYIQMLI